MKEPRIFVNPEQVKNNSIIIDGEDFHYLVHVLRLKKDSIFTVFDGTGNDIEARITEINKNSLNARIIKNKRALPESRVSIDIAQSVPKKNKMDLIIEKCTELGARNIFPVVSKRTVPQLDSGKENIRIERWQKIAKSASIQSKRNDIPRIMNLTSLGDLIKNFASYDLVIIPWEEEKKVNLKQVLKQKDSIKNVLVIIGPEGGFDEEEVKVLRGKDVKIISLGSRILRTETVALAMLSIISYELGLS